MFNTAHLHPIIVHFPIATIIVGFFADIVSLFFKDEKCLSKTGFYLMLTGTIAAIAAWSSGHLFTDPPTDGEFVKVFTRHETGATITMILMIIGSFFRTWLVIKKREESPLKWIAFSIYFLAVVTITYTGYMGGTMVYGF
jgi:uncharacterized membrane protein